MTIAPAAEARLVLPGLLVLPGWDDDGKRQYDDLKAELSDHAWTCRRADLPDASWAADKRDAATREDGLRQAREDYDALVATAAPDAMAVLGFSYGAYMAALLTQERPVQWLVLRSPALYPDAQWTTPKAALDKQQIDGYRHHTHSATDNRALAACARFRGDVLLIDSAQDEIIPPETVQSYARTFVQARSLTRYTLSGAGHALSKAVWRDDYHRVAVAWLMARCS